MFNCISISHVEYGNSVTNLSNSRPIQNAQMRATLALEGISV